MNLLTYPFGSIASHWEKPEESYRFGYQGQFAEEDEETGFNHFEARAYDPIIGRWMTKDPYFQFHSPYVGMGNDPILYQDSDGRWVHIAAGALIGGGAAIVKLALEPGDIDWSSGRTWGKIGTGALTGAAIAAVPVSALGVVGAGSAAFVGDVVDQGIDVHYGHKKIEDINFKQATVNGLVTSATAGIGGVLSDKLVKHGRDVLQATGKVPWYRLYPNANAAAVNSTFDVSRFIIENEGPVIIDYIQNIHFPSGEFAPIPGDDFFIDYNNAEHSNYGRDRGGIGLREIVIEGKGK